MLVVPLDLVWLACLCHISLGVRSRWVRLLVLKLFTAAVASSFLGHVHNHLTDTGVMFGNKVNQDDKFFETQILIKIKLSPDVLKKKKKEKWRKFG